MLISTMLNSATVKSPVFQLSSSPSVFMSSHFCFLTDFLCFANRNKPAHLSGAFQFSSLLRLFPFPDLKHLFYTSSSFISDQLQQSSRKVIGSNQVIKGKTPLQVHYTVHFLESQIKLILVSAQPQISAWASRRPEEPLLSVLLRRWGDP